VQQIKTIRLDRCSLLHSLPPSLTLGDGVVGAESKTAFGVSRHDVKPVGGSRQHSPHHATPGQYPVALVAVESFGLQAFVKFHAPHGKLRLLLPKLRKTRRVGSGVHVETKAEGDGIVVFRRNWPRLFSKRDLTKRNQARQGKALG